MGKRYKYIQVQLASPNSIKKMSYGEVKNGETINYRTSKPERDGLFCERIFGPTKDFQCDCSKTKRQTDIGSKCERCGIEITEAKVRRERMGHIELACPVVHEWYTKSGKLAILLGLKKEELRRIIYFTSYIVVDPGKDTGLHVDQLLSEQDYAKINMMMRNKFKALSGAEAIEYLLSNIDLHKEKAIIQENLAIAPKQKRINFIKRLEIIDTFLQNNITEEGYDVLEDGKIVGKDQEIILEGGAYITIDNQLVLKNGEVVLPGDYEVKTTTINKNGVDFHSHEAILSDGSKIRFKYQEFIRLEYMVLHTLPVLPPDLRPLVQLDGGRYATTDINKLYKRIIDRNKRLVKLQSQNAPQIIIKNEKRMIQESVDALIDNSKKKSRRVMERNRPLKSLSELLQGKGGRFRQNLLGKRVDYSGRSVIVVGPNLEMHQCGLPKKMALKLFRPFIIKELMELHSDTISSNKAKNMIDKESPQALQALAKVIREHPVLLNRAPTLHRLGIQAFEPILVEGKAIRLHPLSCPAFNADFDGDQMAVHLPLSEEAQAEARLLMLASNNILNLKDGKPIVTPSQDMVLGNYYLTIEAAGYDGEGRVFMSTDEAEIAYENKEIKLHSRIVLPISNFEGYKFSEEQLNDYKYLITTYGKLIFNTILPVEEFPNTFAYLNEPTDDNLRNYIPMSHFIKKGENIKEKVAALPLNRPFKKGYIGDVIAHALKICKTTETSKMLDKIKDLGFKYSTIAGITISAADVTVLDSKKEIVNDAHLKVEEYKKFYDRGLLTDEKRSKLVIEVWEKAKNKLEVEIKESIKNESTTNHIYMMADSGARGNASNFTQLSGMRGLMASPNGGTMELPVISAFIEGVKMSEFFISTHGARKGSTDTALKTADSGYLTRRLVDVAQEVIVRDIDCGTDRGTVVSTIYEKPNQGGSVIEGLYDRIAGRYTAAKVIDPETGEIIIGKNEFITDDIAELIIARNIKEVKIRTTLKCNSKNGICVHCYGRNLATGEDVEVGEAIGVIAAQSIGEPGTQLTMRTFHSGGVAGSDITQGLPRVEQLFESRRPKNPAIVANCSGIVKSITVNYDKNHKEIIIEHETFKTNIQHFTDSAGSIEIVNVGDHVIAGDKLCEGSIWPVDLLRASNVDRTQEYIIDEVQKVYRSQGVEIQDKHIEIIVGQMFKNVLIIETGDTNLLEGTEVSARRYREENERCINAGLKPAIARNQILSITKSAVKSESFLSAASFQQTTRVLTDAVFKGQKDYLVGLKENVIIGGLIPAGTGVLDNIDIEFEDIPDDYDIDFEEFEEYQAENSY